MLLGFFATGASGQGGPAVQGSRVPQSLPRGRFYYCCEAPVCSRGPQHEWLVLVETLTLLKSSFDCRKHRTHLKKIHYDDST